MTVEAEEARIGAAEAQVGAPLPPLPALGVLAGLVAVIVVYEALAGVLHVAPVFPALLMLFYWAAVKHLAIRELPGAILGSLGGVFNAALFAILPRVMGPSGILVALLIVLVAFYVLLVGWAPVLFNNAYMLLLTAAGIPEVLGAGRFVGMALSILLGAAIFGAVVGLPLLIQRSRSGRKPERRVAP